VQSRQVTRVQVSAAGSVEPFVLPFLRSIPIEVPSKPAELNIWIRPWFIRGLASQRFSYDYAPSILGPSSRQSEQHSIRLQRQKVSLSFAASVLSVALSLLPASGQSTEFKEPDYSKFKVEDGQITLEFWS
jgi:hypothetical protein